LIVINGCFQTEWLTQRHDDPSLSSEGLAQTIKLSKHFSKSKMIDGCNRYQQIISKLAKRFLGERPQIHFLRKNPNSFFDKLHCCLRVKMFSSPMRRACQTAQAIANGAKDCRVEVFPDLCEVGGIYRAQKTITPTGNFEYVKGPGAAMSRSEILRFFPSLDAERLPADGPWDGGRGFESTSAAIARAGAVADWLRSPRLHADVGDQDLVVLVSHADFLALLLANLHRDGAAAVAEVSPDLDVSRHGVSERQLEARLPAAAPPGPEDVACVYSRYRVSLASSSLIEIGAGGAVTAVLMNDKSYLSGSKKCCIQ
jgi:broad specificity phosphatase PhoE